VGASQLRCPSATSATDPGGTSTPSAAWRERYSDAASDWAALLTALRRQNEERTLAAWARAVSGHAIRAA